MFEDLGFSGISVQWEAEHAIIWTVQETGNSGPVTDMLWSVCQELEEHRCPKSAHALMQFDRTVRLLFQGFSKEQCEAKWSHLVGVKPNLNENRWGNPKPQPWISGDLSWQALSRPFESKSHLFYAALTAFEEEGLLAGKGKSAWEAQELEQLIPQRPGSGEDQKKRGGAL